MAPKNRSLGFSPGEFPTRASRGPVIPDAEDKSGLGVSPRLPAVEKRGVFGDGGVRHLPGLKPRLRFCSVAGQECPGYLFAATSEMPQLRLVRHATDSPGSAGASAPTVAGIAITEH